MNTKQKNTALAAGIVSGLTSLPLPWMTLHNATFTADNSSILPFPLPQIPSLTGNAFNGTVSFPVATPLWFVVCVAIIANAVQLMRASTFFEIPKFVEWTVALIALAWVVSPMIAIFSGVATPGIGWVLELVCAGVPLACLIIPTKDKPKESEITGKAI